MSPTDTLPSELAEEPCWRAVERRDAEQDGRFVFAVVTTGIYCRPSCPARRPRRENARFFRGPGAAEASGFRPCRRCRPRAAADPTTARVLALCDEIRARCDSGEPLTLEALGALCGWSPAHLQRRLRAVLGVSPRQFVEACRVAALKRELRDGSPVTRAIYEAGFGSSSQVYERAGERLGMSPGAYRRGGEGLEISFALGDCPLGRLLVAATDRGLCAVELGDDDQELAARLRREFPRARIERVARPSTQLASWMEGLRRHLEGERLPALPVDLQGTVFQERVWSYLRTIPAGASRSYGEVAAAIGSPGAGRAVARACAANRVAVVVPCHRVLRADGGLGGYRWGVERKRRLLAEEATAQAAGR